MENRSWSSTAGTPGTKTARSGVRPFRRTTARLGNGPFSTCPNESLIERPREYLPCRTLQCFDGASAACAPGRGDDDGAVLVHELTAMVAGAQNQDDAVIRVYDAAGNLIETHEHKGEFKGRY